ncbi:hypothetical protein ACH3XW_33210 [Acanthocheilonema viteae]|uniref:Uncharacterized protein n=1 Tax=Acanthocheilonema viteae TaxID=6277 RepID=A0A498SUR2_ACAVI|nr:unnamed protein product [Acanthocheilonema viteae]
MDETSVVEHLSYGKDEFQITDDVIQEDNLKIESNVTATVVDPFNQHDCSTDLQIQPVRLSTDYPMKPERRTSLNSYNGNTTEALKENAILDLEQKCYDDNGLSGNENIPKTHSPDQESLHSDHQPEETYDIREELQDDIDTRIHELHDNKMSNDVQYNSLVNETDGFESISNNNDSLITETNESNLKNENVLEKAQLLENSVKKSDDTMKISDKLEAFNRNNEISNSPMKISRSKIEETEMPTKGVVSNLKSLFESNAIHNNHDTCKSASYKLEYGVGRSSGTLNKGVFH